MFSKMLAALFPARCVGCRAAANVFCSACRPAPAPYAVALGGGCEVRAVGRYAGPLRRAVLAFKRGRRDVGAVLATLLAERVRRELPADCVFVPVPTASARRRERGFDQGVLLAQRVGALTGHPVLAVLRQVSGDAQRGRSRAARLRARGRFACEAGGLVTGVRVVLVDDVLTTGATLRDAARAVAAGGGDVVGAIVLALAG